MKSKETKGLNLGGRISAITKTGANRIVFIITAHFPIELSNHSSTAAETFTETSPALVVSLRFVWHIKDKLLVDGLLARLTPHLEPFLILVHQIRIGRHELFLKHFHCCILMRQAMLVVFEEVGKMNGNAHGAFSIS